MFLHLRDMEVRPILFDLVFQPGEIDFSEDGLTQVGPLQVAGRADLLASVEEVRVQGTLQAQMGSDCERCLEPAQFSIDRSFDLFYLPAGAEAQGGEVAIKDNEADLAFFEGDGIDLREILREQVLLALPMQRLCRADCRGLCPQCGVNRNIVPCSCVLELPDERWAALRRLSAN